MLRSFLVVLSFISVIPVPQRFIPEWDSESLRYFCPMLELSGAIFGALWLGIWHVLSLAHMLSPALRGLFMTIFTLAITGGLHLDGLMDSCDALFSHRDRETRLRILSSSRRLFSSQNSLLSMSVLLLSLCTHGSEWLCSSTTYHSQRPEDSLSCSEVHAAENITYSSQ